MTTSADGSGSVSVAATVRSSLGTLRSAFSRKALPEVTSSAFTSRRGRLNTEPVLSTARASSLFSCMRNTPLVCWLATNTSDAVLVGPTLTRRLPTSSSPKNSDTSLANVLVEALPMVAKIAC